MKEKRQKGKKPENRYKGRQEGRRRAEEGQEGRKRQIEEHAEGQAGD